MASRALDGLPVVCTGLHSQLAPVCAALAGRRVVYVQLGGGALPVSLSDTVRALKARKLLETAIAVVPVPRRRSPVRDGRLGPRPRRGPRGRRRRLRDRPGDRRYRRRASATAAWRWRTRRTPPSRSAGARSSPRACRSATSAIAIAGSRTTHGPRSSCASARCASRGRAGLDRPDGLEVVEVDVAGWEGACAALPLSHMGRGPEDDPWFFAAAFAAGRLAAG